MHGRHHAVTALLKPNVRPSLQQEGFELSATDRSVPNRRRAYCRARHGPNEPVFAARWRCEYPARQALRFRKSAVYVCAPRRPSRVCLQPRRCLRCFWCQTKNRVTYFDSHITRGIDYVRALWYPSYDDDEIKSLPGQTFPVIQTQLKKEKILELVKQAIELRASRFELPVPLEVNANVYDRACLSLPNPGSLPANTRENFAIPFCHFARPTAAAANCRCDHLQRVSAYSAGSMPRGDPRRADTELCKRLPLVNKFRTGEQGPKGPYGGPLCATNSPEDVLYWVRPTSSSSSIWPSKWNKRCALMTGLCNESDTPSGRTTKCIRINTAF